MYGAQIGLAALMLVTVCLLTQASKRRSPIFAFNVLALILEVIKSSLLAVYMSSEWNNPYAYFADDQSRITRQDQANSIAAPIIKLLEIICVESSLVLQVRTILFTERKLLRHWAMVLSASISLMTMGVELGLMIINVKSIASLSEAPPIQNRLASIANLTITASICFFMLIFVLKLGFALKNRRKLGVRKFGPMQVVFIMGVQTMIVPGNDPVLPSRMLFSYSRINPFSYNL
jgi:pheromone alpha factor receptor